MPYRRYHRAVTVTTLACLALLGACVQAPTSKPATEAAITTDQSQIAAVVKPPALPATTPPKPPRSTDLSGLKADDLIPLFGHPALRRVDRHAQIWRYRGDACLLYLFLYQLKSGGNFEVRHLEAVRTANADKNSEPASMAETQACIDGLWQRANSRQTS